MSSQKTIPGGVVSGAVNAVRIAAVNGRAVQVSRTIENQAGYRVGAIRAKLLRAETVEHPFFACSESGGDNCQPKNKQARSHNEQN